MTNIAKGDVVYLKYCVLQLKEDIEPFWIEEKINEAEGLFSPKYRLKNVMGRRSIAYENDLIHEKDMEEFIHQCFDSQIKELEDRKNALLKRCKESVKY